MGLFSKKQRSPEELEEKSRREKEWANRCYNAGEQFAEKFNLRTRVERLNVLVNKYPKTFFIGMLTVIGGSFFINLLVMRCEFNTKAMTTDINSISIQRDTSRDIVKQEINKLYFEMDNLNTKLESYMTKDSLTRNDSLAIGRIILNMQRLNAIIEGKESGEGLVKDTGNQTSDSLSAVR